MDPKWLVNFLLPFLTRWTLLGLTALGIALTAQQTDAINVTVGVILTAIVAGITKLVNGYFVKQTTAKAVDARTQALVGELDPKTEQLVKVMEKDVLNPKTENPEPLIKI